MREAVILIAVTLGIVSAQDARDFSGVWKLNPSRSEVQNLPAAPESFLKVEQQGPAMRFAAGAHEGTAATAQTYLLDGKASRYQAGGSAMNTMTKWEGDALLVNTLVSGARDYTIMERWKKSRDGNVLTIRRTISSMAGEREAVLVYEKPGYVAPAAPPSQSASNPVRTRNETPSPRPREAIRQPAPRFSAKSLDGDRFTNETLIGKVVLLQFWTTWCPVCRADQDVVDSITQDFAGDGLVVLAVNVGESKRKIKQYLDRSPRNCKVVSTEDTNLASAFSPNAYPTYVLIDREGRVAATQRGGGEWGLQQMLSKVGLPNSAENASPAHVR